MSKARLRDFDGSTPVDDWIRHFNLVADANKSSWSDSKLEGEDKENSFKTRCISEIQLHLSGSLQIWLDTIGDGEKKDPKALLELLKSHLLGPDFDDDWHHKANDFKREDFVSQQDYMVHKVQALNKVMPADKNTNKLQLEMFTKGLPLEIQSWIKTQDKDKRDTIDKVHMMAMGFEKALANQKLREENINPTRQEPK